MNTENNTFALYVVSRFISLVVGVLFLADLFIEGNPFIYMIIGMSVFKMGVDGYRNEITGVMFSGLMIGIYVMGLLFNYIG